MTLAEDLNAVIAQYHRSMGEFMKGNPEPAKELFSESEDVTLGNPFGPFARGWRDVTDAMERAASNYRDGDAVAFDNIGLHVTPDLACVVEVERLTSKVGGRDNVVPLALRVTTVLRPENGVSKIVHRHADPITTARPAESVIQA